MQQSETARSLTYNKAHRLATFRGLGLAERSAVFTELSPIVQQSILKYLRVPEMVELLDHLDMQHAERVLAHITPAKRREEVVKRLKGDVKEKVDLFLRFHPRASLSLINFNYLYLPSTLTVGEVASHIEDHYRETGRYPEVLIHDRGSLKGEVPFSALVIERNSVPIDKHLTLVPTISYQASVESIVSLLSSTESPKVVVLDTDESVLGIIYADAAKQLFSQLPADSLYDFTGVDDSERPFDSVYKKVFNRYRWLILNLATTFVAGSVILAFQDTLDAITILSIYIPIIAGMGSNAASQAFAVTLRGLTLGTISLKTAMPALKNEVLAGLFNGLIIGTIVMFISAIWNGNPLLGVAVGLSLVCVHVISPLAGAFLPLLLKYLGKDPAATSSIFITTITDVLGLILLFGFATIILL